MQKPLHFRVVGLLVFLISLGALASALSLQVIKDWFPCALCILQRYVYIFTGLVGVLMMMYATPRRRAWRLVFPGVLLLIALTGVGLALYHVWVLANPNQTCGVDPMQTWLNSLPWASWWWLMFEADGLCTAEYPPFLGLSLPAWSAVGFLTQAVLSLWARWAGKNGLVFRGLS